MLCWDIFDFLPKAAAQALARQIVRMLRPGGAVMGFFCSTAASHHGRPSPSTRSPTRSRSATARIPARRRRQARPLNRDIIQMFDGLAVADSFLLKSNTREILLRRRS